MYAIRPAKDDDAEVIFSFDRAAQTDAGRRAAIQRAVAAGGCFVATAEEQVVGYGEFEHSFFHNGFIAMLYAHPDHRRRGVGAALMQHFESICRTPKLFTSTNLSNQPMQSLLAKLGYTLTGMVDNLDENDPELIYFKRVAPAAQVVASSAPGQVGAMWDEWRAQMNAMIDAQPNMLAADRQDMKEQVAKIQAEASKGAQADPTRLEKLINTIAVIGPAVFEIVATTLGDPLKGIGLILQKISDRAKIKRAASA